MYKAKEKILIIIIRYKDFLLLPTPVNYYPKICRISFVKVSATKIIRDSTKLFCAS